MTAAARFFVAGRVQGVFFRASTRALAQELGLRGYARNRADGRVEVLAVGDEDSLLQLEAWLWQGPQHAQVNSVQHEGADATEAGAGFTLG